MLQLVDFWLRTLTNYIYVSKDILSQSVPKHVKGKQPFLGPLVFPLFSQTIHIITPQKTNYYSAHPIVYHVLNSLQTYAYVYIYIYIIHMCIHVYVYVYRRTSAISSQILLSYSLIW